ncbi:MAG: hypothetical protein ACRD26_08335 [Vicinamibacterales bacterium]
MRIAAAIAVAALPVVVAAAADDPKKDAPGKTRVEVTGCVKGSTLTETSLRVSGVRDENPARRWRLRGPKALMNRIKKHAGKELEITGTTTHLQAGRVIGSTRIGKTNIYIGGQARNAGRDPLPEQPTIDVEAFDPTGEACR